MDLTRVNKEEMILTVPRTRAPWFVLAVLLALSPLFAGVPALAQQPVEITIMSENSFWRPEMIDWLEEVWIPQFHAENPHIRIRPIIRAGSFDVRLQQLTVMIAGGVAPDIVVVGHTHPFIEGVGKGWLLPLDAYLERWEDTRNIVPIAWEHPRHDGVTYAIPQGSTPRVIAYNKAFFAEAGLDPETPPATWAEMLEYSRRLLRTSDSHLTRRGIHLALGGLSGAQEFQLWHYVNEGDILTADGRAPAFNDEKGRQALQFMRDQFDLNNPAGFNDNLSSSPTTGWLNGQVAMFRAAPSLGTNIANNRPDMMEDFGSFALPPRTREQTPGSGTSINGAAILRTTSHPDEAWEVLSALMTRDVNEQFIRLSGHVSTRTDVVPLVREIAPELIPWYEVMNVARAFPGWPSGGGYTYSTALGDPVRAGTYAQVPVETALEEAARQVQIMIDAFWDNPEGGD